MKYSVDVVIPTYNCKKYITKSITSVVRQGEYINKIFVVDDGSTDDTKKIVEKLQKKYPKISYIFQKNQGPSTARNKGIELSKSEYIALLDADDTWENNKINKQLNEFKKSKIKNLGVVYTNFNYIDENGESINNLKFKLDKKIQGNVHKKLLSGNSIAGSDSAVLVKKECFDKVGLFDITLRSYEDWDMWIRISKLYQFDFIDEPLVKIRKRNDAIQSDEKEMIIGNVKFVNKRHNNKEVLPRSVYSKLRKDIFRYLLLNPKETSIIREVNKIAESKTKNELWGNKVKIMGDIIWSIGYTIISNFIKVIRK